MLYFPPWKVAVVIGTCLLGILFALPNVFSSEEVAEFPGWLPSKQITLGLDLQGGAHLLIQVDVDAVIKERMEQELDSVRQALRESKVLYTQLKAGDKEITVHIRDAADVDKAVKAIRDIEGGSAITILGSSTGPDFRIEQRANNTVAMVMTEVAIEARKRSVVAQSIETVRRRIDSMGTTEPVIQGQGEDRILVEVPGLDDPQHLKDLLGKTAKLSFHLVDMTATAKDVADGRISPSSEVLPAAKTEHNEGGPSQYVVRRAAVITGDMLKKASPSFQNGAPVVHFELTAAGGRRFAEVTQENVGRPFAIVLDNQVISAPRINSPILGGSGVIEGGFTVAQTNDLSVLLNSGSLPAPLHIIQERTVSASLGKDSIDEGTRASIVGMVAVVVYMLLAYGGFGLAANVALLINLCMIVGGLSLFGATLTLPGIAGIVLTIGMAVDANVLIFERVKEETRAGKSPLAALEAGYSRAFVTILDANITTLIAAVILFWFGSGPVQGFAVTLSIGIFTSVFTAVTVSRLILATWARRTRPKALPI